MSMARMLAYLRELNIARQPCAGCRRLWDRAGCARLGPGGRVRRHGRCDTDAGRDTVPVWAGSRCLWRLPPARCCDWDVEADLWQLHEEDCALELAGQSGVGRGCSWDRPDRSRHSHADHFPKRRGGRRTGSHTLLGWNLPSHLREISWSERDPDPGPVLATFAPRGK